MKPTYPNKMTILDIFAERVIRLNEVNRNIRVIDREEEP